MRQAAFLLLPLLLASHPAAAEPIRWGSAEHNACLEGAVADPEAALAEARRLEAAGGGAAARHCAALALLEVGDVAGAAQALEDLGMELFDGPDILRARLFGEAGNAWMVADRLDRALPCFDTAVYLIPDEADLRLDRGLARALAGDYTGAIADLEEAERLAPPRVELFVYRATARRFLGQGEAALADIEKALALAPANPAALLERGNIRRILGDGDGARRDWLAVLAVAPEGAAADAARRNLERLDLSPG